MFGPGQRIDADGAQGDGPLARVEDLTNFDLHLCIGSFVMSRQHTGLDNCIKRTWTQKPDISLKNIGLIIFPTIIVVCFTEFRCTS